ncbi:MAG TPA: hypothetical protein VFK03_02935 [Candidatus Saccharimonadales bacterium]|nr:hypothetical protein [Candidatus Saccharimonadales bacterium]
MAGFYPDVPGNRFAYHLDGTQVFMKNDSTNELTQLSTTSLSLMNDEDSDAFQFDPYGRTIIFVFPEPRQFSGYYISTDDTNVSTIRTSTDTTNGLDGTWVTLTSDAVQSSGSPIPSYRTNAQTVAGGVVKAISMYLGDEYSTDNVYALHLYGSIPLTSNPDRLIFWEPINDNATDGAYFDWGDIGQGTSKTKTFRIKNNSSTKTASSITLASTAVTYGMTVQFSTDDVNYSASINIGDLAAGATSSVLYVKRSVPANEPMQVQACYFTADAASWA